MMCIGGKDKFRVAIRKFKKIKMTDLEPAHRCLLASVFRTTVMKSASEFISCDTKGLISDSLSNVFQSTPLEYGLGECLRLCGKASVEKRLLWAIILGCAGKERDKKIVASDVQYTSRLTGLGVDGGANSDDDVCEEEEDDGKTLPRAPHND